jgi:hypothetical protein
LKFVEMNGPEPFGKLRAAECEAMPDRMRNG